MTDPLFLADLDGLAVGDRLVLDGDEGRHAAVVKRITAGEAITVSDGAGRALRVLVDEVTRSGVAGAVTDDLTRPEPALRFHVVQALAKGDRQDLALELLTELGATVVTAWQSHRSITRWDAARAAKNLAKWQAVCREATKQSRRHWVPAVTEHVLSTTQLVRLVEQHPGPVLVLHEDATDWIEQVDLPDHGEVVLVVGPEGGISPGEVDQLTAAGARLVLVSDAVLRTSSAGAVGVALLAARSRR